MPTKTDSKVKKPVRKPHVCSNAFRGEGARGGCYVEIAATDKEGIASLDVGWSCVVVHRKEIPVSWLSEVIAIASDHPGGIAGFLKKHDYSGESYALMCDPAKPDQTTNNKQRNHKNAR